MTDGEAGPRRVLMVLYHFPPIGGVSMARNVRNVQYLPQSGWTPVVLAPRDPGEVVDADALSLVAPDVEVIRARSPGPRQLRPLVARLRGRRASHGEPTTPAASSGRAADAPAAAPRLARLQRLLFFPDDEVGWLPFALAAALRANRAARFDAVYSTASPITAHLVAGVVKRVTGVPWVAEFRDPWLGNPLAGRLPWLERRLQARLERWIVHTATGLVFTSPSTMEAYRRRYPRAAPMVTIPNGHDRSERLEPRPRAGGPGPFRLVWTGALYRPAELHQFLEGLDAVLGRRPALADELEVLFYGHVSDACAAVAASFDAPAMRRMVRFPGFVSRREALRAVADADAALVLLGGGPGMGHFLPGKLFDYLGQSKQILAVLPPGDARDLLVELDWGVIADPDPGSIAAAVEELLARPPVTAIADPDGRYDRVVLAARLAASLDAAMRTTTPDPPSVAVP